MVDADPAFFCGSTVDPEEGLFSELEGLVEFLVLSLPRTDDCLAGPTLELLELTLPPSALGGTVDLGGVIGCLFLFGEEDVLSSGLFEIFSLLLFTFLVAAATWN